MLPVLHTPKPGDYYLVYPTNHYVIIRRVVRDYYNEYGEISDQSMLVFTSPQEKELAQGLSNAYLILSPAGSANLEWLLPDQRNQPLYS